jgi:hypothetical protein
LTDELVNVLVAFLKAMSDKERVVAATAKPKKD